MAWAAAEARDPPSAGAEAAVRRPMSGGMVERVRVLK